MHNFARQFKQSAGAPTHVFLTQKRVERAQEMLVQTKLSLAEIAFAVGFFDQGHLARHFRQMLGTTPREFRWLERYKQTPCCPTDVGYLAPSSVLTPLIANSTLVSTRS